MVWLIWVWSHVGDNLYNTWDRGYHCLMLLGTTFELLVDLKFGFKTFYTTSFEFFTGMVELKWLEEIILKHFWFPHSNCLTNTWRFSSQLNYYQLHILLIYCWSFSLLLFLCTFIYFVQNTKTHSFIGAPLFSLFIK